MSARGGAAGQGAGWGRRRACICPIAASRFAAVSVSVWMWLACSRLALVSCSSEVAEAAGGASERLSPASFFASVSTSCIRLLRRARIASLPMPAGSAPSSRLWLRFCPTAAAAGAAAGGAAVGCSTTAWAAPPLAAAADNEA